MPTRSLLNQFRRTMSRGALLSRFSRRAASAKNRALRRTHRLLSRGDAVTCVLCGWTGGRFFGEGICPQCNSRARHRLIPYAAEHFGLDAAGEVLLHIGPNGPEVNWVGRWMRPKLHLKVDIEYKPMATINCDARVLPFADGTIDIAVAWHVLEHIRADVDVMREVARVLVVGGHALMSVPIVPASRQKTFEDPSMPPERNLELYGHRGHVRSPGLDYGDRFAFDGFAVRRLLLAEANSCDANRYGLSPAHVAWCFRKVAPQGH